MADPFVAEIRIFPFAFAPTGWALCNGQLLAISQNTALFSLLGTTYGGDGRSNFALPNLQDAIPLHAGQGPGLSLYDLGESGGVDYVTLLGTEMPVHTHALNASNSDAYDQAPTNDLLAAGVGGIEAFGSSAPDTALAGQAVNAVGGALPHNNLQPYLTLSFCIALQGVFPSRP